MPLLTLWTGLGMKPLPPERWSVPGWEIRWLEAAPPLPGEQDQAWAQRLLALVPAETDLLGGFSLGAQLAQLQHALDPERFPRLLLLSGFTHRRQWHPLLRMLRFIRLPQLLLQLPPRVLMAIVSVFLHLLPAAERRRFDLVLHLWPPAAWRQVLRFLLRFEAAGHADVLQICGAADKLLRPASPAVRLPEAGHFLLPSEGHQIGMLLHDWWMGRKKTG